jgi:hypothetical protein
MSLTAPTHLEHETALQPQPPARRLAWLGIIGPAWFTSLVVLQGLLLPDYSHVRMPISALAAWPTGWIQNLNFLASGTLAMTFAIALHRSIRPTRRGTAGAVLLALGGRGLAPHGATGLGLIVLSRRLSADPRWHDLAVYTLLSGVVVLTLFVAVGFFALEAGTPLHPWAGLIQRILGGAWFAWLIVVALHMRAL